MPDELRENPDAPRADPDAPRVDVDWDAEEFRRRGYEVIDWIADYLRDVDKFPVKSQAQPGQVRAALPDHPPQEPEPFAAILRDLDEIVMPGITHWQSPSFFAYFPGNSSGPSILADAVTAGLGVQGMLWETSPACTELEMHMLDWFCDLLGLPHAFRFDSDGGGV